MPSLDDLPNELLKHIFAELWQEELLALALVNRLTNILATERLYYSIFSGSTEAREWCDDDCFPHAIVTSAIHLLNRTLSSGKFWLPVRHLIIIDVKDRVEKCSVEVLLSLVHNSLQSLRLDRCWLGQQNRPLPDLRQMPLLTTLSINQTSKEWCSFDLANQRSFELMPTLRHFSILTTTPFTWQALENVLQSAPLLKSLRGGIAENWKNLFDGNHIPNGLQRALQPISHQLEDLIFYVRDEADDEPAPHVGCLSCCASSFMDLSSLRRLCIPLNWLLCNENATAHFGADHDTTSVSRMRILPPSLEVLQLQISRIWLQEESMFRNGEDAPVADWPTYDMCKSMSPFFEHLLRNRKDLYPLSAQFVGGLPTIPPPME